MKLIFEGEAHEYEKVFQAPQGKAYAFDRMEQLMLQQMQQVMLQQQIATATRSTPHPQAWAIAPALRADAQRQAIDPIDAILAELPAPPTPLLPASTRQEVQFTPQPQPVWVEPTPAPSPSVPVHTYADILPPIETTPIAPDAIYTANGTLVRSPLPARFRSIALWCWVRSPYLLFVAMCLCVGTFIAAKPGVLSQSMQQSVGRLQLGGAPTPTPTPSPSATPTSTPTPVGHPPTVIDRLDQQLRSPAIPTP